MRTMIGVVTTMNQSTVELFYELLMVVKVAFMSNVRLTKLNKYFLYPRNIMFEINGDFTGRNLHLFFIHFFLSTPLRLI